MILSPTLLSEAKEHIFPSVTHLSFSNYLINIQSYSITSLIPNQFVCYIIVCLDPWPRFRFDSTSQTGINLFIHGIIISNGSMSNKWLLYNSKCAYLPSTKRANIHHHKDQNTYLAVLPSSIQVPPFWHW